MNILLGLVLGFLFIFSCVWGLNQLTNRKTRIVRDLADPNQKPLAIKITRPTNLFSPASTVDYSKNLVSGREDVYLFHPDSKRTVFVTYEPPKGITKVYPLGKAYLSRSSFNDKWTINYEGLEEFVVIEESHPLVQELLKEGEKTLAFARKRVAKPLAKIEKKLA